MWHRIAFYDCKSVCWLFGWLVCLVCLESPSLCIAILFTFSFFCFLFYLQISTHFNFILAQLRTRINTFCLLQYGEWNYKCGLYGVWFVFQLTTVKCFDFFSFCFFSLLSIVFLFVLWCFVWLYGFIKCHL